VAGVVWRRGMVLRLKLDPNSARVEELTTKHLGEIAAAAVRLPASQRDQFFVHVGRMLRKRVRGRPVTDVDINEAVKIALVQAATAAVAIARG
jgi:hypothetical protein